MAVPFSCLQCGLCCLGIGEIVRMKECVGPFRYIVTNEIVREEHAVEITPEYRELFADTSVQEEHGSACFFVRRRPDGKYVCTIHPYRLFICRDYGCCNARIYKNGREFGRIKNEYTLITEDTVLRTLWHDEVQTKSLSRKEAVSVLEAAGYSVVLYDLTLEHE
ncbi:MAG TPA: hypothetical protein O0X39_00715 [Methanocorpusculum sp.]|nr:hypothetical protein [Methanocorpusculum sp.]